MKRKLRLTLSVIALMMSISLMAFGVYASATPKLTISGSVVFTTSASQINITGTIINGFDANNQAIPFVLGQSYHYYDYTDSEKTTLANWNINGGQSLYFWEDSDGVKPIQLKFDFVNNSPFYTVAKFENVAANNNVSVVYETQVVMDIRGNSNASKSSLVTYNVVDDSVPASSAINFNISFDKYLYTGEFESFSRNITNYEPLSNDEISFYQNEYENTRNLKFSNNIVNNQTNKNNSDVLNNEQSLNKEQALNDEQSLNKEQALNDGQNNIEQNLHNENDTIFSKENNEQNSETFSDNNLINNQNSLTNENLIQKSNDILNDSVNQNSNNSLNDNNMQVKENMFDIKTKNEQIILPSENLSQTEKIASNNKLKQNTNSILNGDYASNNNTNQTANNLLNDNNNKSIKELSDTNTDKEQSNM